MKKFCSYIFEEFWSDFKKNLPFYLFSVLIYYLLFNTINTFIIDKLNIIDLRYIEYLTLSFMLILIVSFSLLQSKKSYYIVPNHVFNALKVLVLILLIDEFFINFWNYKKFDNFEIINNVPIYPLVIISITAIQYALKLIKYYNRFTTNDNVTRNTNLAIENEKDDIFDFKESVSYLVSYIDSLKYEDSFAVGINSKWGTGKSSYINLIKNQISKIKKEDKEVYKILNFNPWRYSNSDEMIKGFFDELNNCISYNDNVFNKILSTYSEKLVPISQNTLFAFFHNLLYTADDAKTLHQKINKFLGDKRYRVVIFVDDIDRLNNEEVYEVFKLVRNTASFKNFIFIMAYDKEYINYAFDKMNIYNKSPYIDKIVNYEISIPVISKEKIIEYIFRDLEKVFSFKYSVLSHIYGNITKVLQDNFTSLREANLLINNFKLNFIPVDGYVDVKDFLVLELLRLKYPEVYFDLKNNINIYLSPTSNSTNKVLNNKAIIARVNTFYDNKDSIIEVLYLLFNFKELQDPNTGVDGKNLLNSLLVSENHQYYFGADLSTINSSFLDTELFDEKFNLKEEQEPKIIERSLKNILGNLYLDDMSVVQENIKKINTLFNTFLTFNKLESLHQFEIAIFYHLKSYIDFFDRDRSSQKNSINSFLENTDLLLISLLYYSKVGNNFEYNIDVMRLEEEVTLFFDKNNNPFVNRQVGAYLSVIWENVLSPAPLKKALLHKYPNYFN